MSHYCIYLCCLKSKNPWGERIILNNESNSNNQGNFIFISIFLDLYFLVYDIFFLSGLFIESFGIEFQNRI